MTSLPVCVCFLSLFIAVECTASDYIWPAGRRLVNRHMDTVVLRGIGMTRAPESELRHAREELRKMAAMGAECVRLDMEEGWFEGRVAARKSFDYIDTVLTLADRQGIRVILSMCDLDTAVWDEPDIQEKRVERWVSIAKHFRNRPEIAAYNLMREPEPPSIRDYAFFMQYLIDSIREVDTRHLIVVPEPLTGNGLLDFGVAVPFLVGDRLAYGFSEYEPHAFTRQGIEGWPEGTSWPGEILESVREVSIGGRRKMQGGGKPQVLSFESISPDESTYNYVSPRVFAIGVGRARFERVVLEEIAVFDRKAGDRAVFRDTFSDIRSMWREYPSGARAGLERGTVPGEGRLVLDGAGLLVSAQPFTAQDIHRLPPASANRRFRLAALVSASVSAEAGIELVYLNGVTHLSGPADLNARIQARAAWARRADVPLLLMDFAAPRHAPQDDEIRWMETVRDACETRDISWMYRVLREFDDPRTADHRQTFAAFWGTPDLSDDSSAEWPELKKFLVDSFKHSSAVPGTPETPKSSAFGGSRANPVQPPPAGCWFGAQALDSPLEAAAASPTTFNSIMQFARRVNKSPAWIHIAHPWKNPDGTWTSFPEDELREIVATGAAPLLAWESGREGAQITDDVILEGRADTYIRTWADAARRFDKPFVLRLGRGIDARAFRHVQILFDARGAAHVSWMWSPVPSTGRDTSQGGDVDWPWDSRVDWIGLDIYDRPAPRDTAEGSGLFPVGEVREFVEAMKKYRTPICLSEVACESVKGQAEWWADALQKLRTPEMAPVRAFVLMESLPSAGGPGRSPPLFRLRNDAVYFIGKELSSPHFVGSD